MSVYPNQQQKDIDALIAHYDAINAANNANKAYGNLAPQDKVAVWTALNPSPNLCCPTGPYIPHPPVGSIFLGVVSGSAILFWSYTDSGQNGFHLERCLDGVSFAPFATLATASLRLYTDQTVVEDNTYWYRINAYNNDGTSSWSNTASIYFPITPPIGPISLSVDSGSAVLNWVFTHDRETGWNIEKSSNGTVYANIAVIPTASTRTYIDNVVTESYTYWYRVNAYNTAGTTSYSNTASIYFTLSPPMGPISLSVDSGSALLSWSFVDDTQDGFHVERSLDAVTYSLYHTVATMSARTDRDDVVTYGNTYWYRVNAYNASGSSEYSNTASIHFPTPIPWGPISLSLGSGSALLSWSYTDTTQDGFVFEKSTDGVAYGFLGQFPFPQLRAWGDNDVLQNTDYWYRIYAYNGSGSTPYSNTASIRFVVPPPDPENLMGNQVSNYSESVALSWSFNHPLTFVEGYIVERSTTPPIVWNYITTSTSAVTQAIDSTVSYRGDYSYRVWAVSGSLTSSNYAGIFAQYVFPPVPPAPVLDVVSGSANLSWNSGSNYVNFASIQKTTDFVNYVEITAPSNSIMSYVDTAVSEPNSYSYRAASVNETGTSSYSNTVYIEFSASVVTPISLSVASGSAILTWVSQSNNRDYFVVQRSLDGITYSDFVNVTTESVVTNGGFETGNFNGWTIVDTSTSTTVVSDASYVHDGTYGAQIGPWGGITGSVTQTLFTENGQTYSMSFWLSASAGDMFQVWWDGNLVASLTSASGDIPLGWTQLSYVVTASGATTQLQFLANNEPAWFALDTITVKPVNLPATYIDTSVTSSVGGATYWYQVARVNSIETSSFSNTASITFTAPPPPPEAPLFLQVFSGSAILVWQSGSGAPAPDHWAVFRSVTGPSGSFAQIGTSSAANLTYRDTTVLQNITYDYKVAGVSITGTGSFSNIADIAVVACQGIDFNPIVYSGCLGYSSGSTYRNIYGVSVPFTTSVSQSISVWGRSPDFDSYLTLIDSNGNVLIENDWDGWAPSGDYAAYGGNASFNYVCPSGSYTIELSSVDNAIGRYMIWISPGSKLCATWQNSYETATCEYISSSNCVVVGEQGSNILWYYINQESSSIITWPQGVQGIAYSPTQDRVFAWVYEGGWGPGWTASIAEYDNTGSYVGKTSYYRPLTVNSAGSTLSQTGTTIFLHTGGAINDFTTQAESGSRIWFNNQSTQGYITSITNALTASVDISQEITYDPDWFDFGTEFQITRPQVTPNVDFGGYMTYDPKHDRIAFYRYFYATNHIFNIFDIPTRTITTSLNAAPYTTFSDMWEGCYSWADDCFYIATTDLKHLVKVNATTFAITASNNIIQSDVISSYASSSGLLILRNGGTGGKVVFADPVSESIVYTSPDCVNAGALFEGTGKSGDPADDCVGAYVITYDPRGGPNFPALALLDRNTFLPANYLTLNSDNPGGFAPDGWYQYSIAFDDSRSRVYSAQVSYDNYEGRLYSIRCTRAFGQYTSPFTASTADTASCLTFKTDFGVSGSFLAGYVAATGFTSSIPNTLVCSNNEVDGGVQYNSNNVFINSDGLFLGAYTSSYVHTYSGKNAVFCKGKFYMLSDGVAKQSTNWEPMSGSSMLVFDQSGSLQASIALTYPARDWDTDGENVYLYEFNGTRCYIETIDTTSDVSTGADELQIGYTFVPGFAFFYATASATASQNALINTKNFPDFGRIVVANSGGTTYIYYNNIYGERVGTSPAPYNIQDTGSGDRIWCGGSNGQALYNYGRLDLSTGSYKGWSGGATYCPITNHMYWGAIDVNDNYVLVETQMNLTFVQSHSVTYNNPECLVWNKKDRTIEIFTTSGTDGKMSVFDPVAKTVVCNINTLASGSISTGEMGWNIDTDVQTGYVYVPHRYDATSLSGSIQIYEM